MTDTETRDAELCTKRTFRSPEEAHRLRKTIKRYGGDTQAKHLNVYRCEVCGWWHLGHSLPRPSVQKPARRTKVRIR